MPTERHLLWLSNSSERKERYRSEGICKAYLSPSWNIGHLQFRSTRFALMLGIEAGADWGKWCSCSPAYLSNDQKCLQRRGTSERGTEWEMAIGSEWLPPAFRPACRGPLFLSCFKERNNRVSIHPTQPNPPYRRSWISEANVNAGADG